MSDQVAAHLAAIAVSIESHQPDGAVMDLLGQAPGLCERVAAMVRGAEVTQALAQIKTAAETWRSVWPRLGHQRDFRGAVAREARLWSQRLLAQQMPSKT